jgi:hypothetical protein
MREVWSINRLAAELRVDRRTVSKYLDLADVKPAGQGPKGPLYRLRDAVAVLADAGVFESITARADHSRHCAGRETGARELAERLLDALAKRLECGALRVVVEVIGAESCTVRSAGSGGTSSTRRTGTGVRSTGRASPTPSSTRRCAG